MVPADTDSALLASPANLERFTAALTHLRAERIAVPPLEAEYLQRVARAIEGDAPMVDEALTEEERAEREADRRYWLPLRQELERLRKGRVSPPRS